MQIRFSSRVLPLNFVALSSPFASSFEQSGTRPKLMPQTGIGRLLLSSENGFCRLSNLGFKTMGRINAFLCRRILLKICEFFNKKQRLLIQLPSSREYSVRIKQKYSMTCFRYGMLTLIRHMHGYAGAPS